MILRAIPESLLWMISSLEEGAVMLPIAFPPLSGRH